MEIRFEDLPMIMGKVLEKVENLEILLKQESSQKEESNPLLTINQVGELIHLSVPTIYAYVQRKEIPFSKRGKRLYFSKAEILDWINENNSKSTSIENQLDNFLSSKRKR